LFSRVRAECGEIGEMNWAGTRVTLLSGEEAQEAFYRASDEQLDQAAAYPFMTPIFGKGVVFDGTTEQRKSAMRNQSLRDKFMRGHAETIDAEVRATMDRLGDEGEVDVLDFFAELTMYTSSACLVGKRFREHLSADAYQLFYTLEKGTDAIAYVNADLPLPVFKERDRARAGLVEMLTELFQELEEDDGSPKELFEVLLTLRDEAGEPRYTIDQITGMFISLMFAGHHTTSGTAAWTLIELLKSPHYMKRVNEEIDALYADGREVSYQALREIPLLERGIKEALRLHPPLIVLMRKVVHDFHYKGFTVPSGDLVAVSPAVSNRMPECFPNPDVYDPDRYAPGRDEDKQLFAWTPFGAGRHRCVGAAFAMMQLKAIFSTLLRSYEFELAHPPDSYRNDHSKMVVQLAQPCRLRYRRRAAPLVAANTLADTAPTLADQPFFLQADLDLCQGHAVCIEEAPDLFEMDPVTNRVVVRNLEPDVGERAFAEAAVNHCPTRALRIEDLDV
jgi:sterol 14-demethylase